LEATLSCTIHDIPFVSVPGRSDLYEVGGNPSSRVRCRRRVVRDVPRCVHPAGFLEVPFMRPLLQGPYFRPSETRRQVEYLCSLRRGYQWDVWLNRNAANNAFTLGIRAPVQTYSQCLAANSGNYSVYNRLPSSWQNGATKFALGNDVSNALFGDANEGTAGLLVGAGAGAAPLGVGTAGTYGRRTASIFDLNLSGTTGPAPTILGKTGAAEAVGWVSGAFELKLAADIGATAAEALNCIGHR